MTEEKLNLDTSAAKKLNKFLIDTNEFADSMLAAKKAINDAGISLRRFAAACAPLSLNSKE